MDIELALEQIGWGKYQTFVFGHCLLAIFQTTLWMEITSLIMGTYQGEEWEIFCLPLALNLGSFSGAIIMSYYSGKVGRSPVFQLTAIIGTAGAVLLCCFHDSYMIHVGLLVIGFCMGGDLVTPYTVLMECIPKNKYNCLTLLTAATSFGISLFILIAYIIDIHIETEVLTWKYLLYFGAIIQGILTYLRGYVVESPVYLYDNLDKKADEVILKISQFNDLENIPLLIYPQPDEVKKDQNFYLMTLLLGFEYLLSTFCSSTLFFFMSSLVSMENVHYEFLLVFCQQASGIPGIICASYFIKSLSLCPIFRFISFLSSGILILLLTFDLGATFTIIISCMVNFSMMSGISLLFAYSQETYCTHSRGFMNGFLTGIGLGSGIFGSMMIGYIQIYFGNLASLMVFSISFFICAACSITLDQYIKAA